MMQEKLTDRFIQTVKPPTKGRLVVTDTEVSGLTLRVTEKGRKSWLIRYRPKGQKQQNHVPGLYPAIKLADARQQAREIHVAARRGLDLPKQERREVEELRRIGILPDFMSDLCNRYVEQHLKMNVRRWEAAKGEIENHIKPHLGELALGEVERSHVREMLAQVASKHPVAANRALKRLRAVFNWAMEHDLAKTNPTLGIKMPTRERPASRTLSDQELATVWKATDRLAYPAREYFTFLILTGQRRDDVRKMHWSEIDLDRNDWAIPAERYKGDKLHLVPLTEAMVGILDSIPFRESGGYVFSPSGGSKPYGNVQKPKRAIEEASGVTDWTLHDLRRTLRTGLSRLGIRPDISERVIGHAVGGSLGQTYDTHEYRDEKLAALKAWGAHVMAAVEGRDVENVVAFPKAQSP